jgi:hypothetical protein
LLALVQLAFALGLAQFGRWSATRLKLASFFLLDVAWLKFRRQRATKFPASGTHAQCRSPD